MNDVMPPQPPPPPKPFAPEKVAGGGGCQKPLLVGCGLLALLLGIAAVVFVVKAKDVLAYAMNQLRAEVVANLPEDAGESDRQHVETGFDAALARIRSGEIDPVALQELQKKLTGAASTAATRRLNREELTSLLAALDKFNQAGAASPAVPATSADASGQPAEEQTGESLPPPAEPSRPPAP